MKAPRWSFVAMLIAVICAAVGGMLQPEPVSSTAPTDVGYITFSYGSGGSTKPTGEKPESKLWYNDGLWWGSLFNTVTEAYHIYRFERSTQSWTDTGVELDNREDSKADVLWDPASQKLYVASHMFTSNATSAGVSSADYGRLYRYSYTSGSQTYSLDDGFPVNVTQGISETLTIAKDSTGRLWVTYVEDEQVMVNHSVTNDVTWTTPYALPVTNTNVTTDDISSIIAFQGNKIGIVWSNQDISGMFMAIHNDGVADNQWQLETIVLGGSQADDHINLKTDSGGRVYVASKTGMGGSNPLIVLYVRSASGTWSTRTVSTGSEAQTRPIVMLYEEQNMVYVFASSDIDGSIYFKQSPVANISFPPGAGTVFIQDSSSPNLDNVSSTKQNVTSAMGMLVIASNSFNRFYYHNDPLEDVIPPPTDTPTNTPTNTPTATNTATDTPTNTATNTPTNTPTATNTATDTPVPPTDTPTHTPTNTPTNTPTDTQSIVLSAMAVCNGPNLEVTIFSGDAPFNITASAGINMPVLGIGPGTMIVFGPEKWDDVWIIETTGDGELLDLGQFKCRSNQRPIQISPPHQTRTTNAYPLFSWQSFPDANNYRVFLFDNKVISQRTIDIRENSDGALSMILSQPLNPGRYFWRVRARVNRVWSLWSTRWTLWVDPVDSVADPLPTIELNPTLVPLPTLMSVPTLTPQATETSVSTIAPPPPPNQR